MSERFEDLPRFSGSLRSNTDLEAKFPLINSNEQLFQLQQERNTFLKSQIEEPRTINALLEHMPAVRRDQMKMYFQKLRNIVQECMGYEEQAQAVEHAALFLFWLMLEQKVILVATTIRVRSIFGSIFSNKWAKIHQTVSSMRELFEDYEIEVLKEWNKSLNKTSENRKMWGDHIKVKFKQATKAEVGSLLDLAPDTICKNAASLGFSMMWNRAAEPLNVGHHNVVKTFLEMSQKDEHTHLISSLAEMLSSRKSNNALQNELIELLGFDHFDLVQDVLSDRSKIGNQLQELEKRAKRLQRTKQKVLKNGVTVATKPQTPICTQIVVQSALEKELCKQQRREQKKMQRLIHKIGRNEKDEDEVKRVINPLQLRMHQQRKLLEQAQHQPLLKCNPKIIYI